MHKPFDGVFNVFKNYIENRVKVTKQELQDIESICTFKNFRKKQYILPEGSVWKHYAFVVQGCLRTYTVDDKGVEHILGFAPENWWAGDRDSLLTGKPSKLTVEAIENSVVLLMSKIDFDVLCKKIPPLNEMVMGIREKSFIASQKRINAVLSYTAREKYLDFIEQYPDLSLRVPQHMIASYLGISAETLSRVRKPSGG